MERGRLFVLGGSGFVGREAVREAVAQGWKVTALARGAETAARLRALGADAVLGDARAPEAWIEAARGADAIVDLVQPELPPRIRPRDIAAVSRAREEMTRALLAGLRALPAPERPLLLSVSGTDDLAPDADGRIGASSPLRDPPTGFGHVGVPVRRLVDADGAAATFVHLGTVYGPGKSFAKSIFPRLARGRMVLPRAARNRLPLVHVRDAARAIVHLAGLGRARLAGRTWLVVDEAGGAPLGEFFDEAAALMGVAPARRVPPWLFSALAGRILLETLTRDLRAEPTDLLATGFRFVHPTMRDGLRPTLSALGYPARRTQARARGPRRAWVGARLAAAVGALVAVNVVDLPLTVRGMRAIAAGEPVLDLRLGYAAPAAYRFLDALGTRGRGTYIEMLWTVDLVLPALFALALWGAIAAGALRRWSWAALAAGTVDYLENGAITALVLAYPARHDALAVLASVLTVAKFTLYLACAVAAVAGAFGRDGSAPARGASA